MGHIWDTTEPTKISSMLRITVPALHLLRDNDKKNPTHIFNRSCSAASQRSNTFTVFGSAGVRTPSSTFFGEPTTSLIHKSAQVGTPASVKSGLVKGCSLGRFVKKPNKKYRQINKATQPLDHTGKSVNSHSEAEITNDTSTNPLNHQNRLLGRVLQEGDQTRAQLALHCWNGNDIKGVCTQRKTTTSTRSEDRKQETENREQRTENRGET